MRAFIVSLLLLIVAGCATQAERAAQVQREVEEMIQLYGPGCENSATRATAPGAVRAPSRPSRRRNRYPVSTSASRNRGFVQ